ncbi:hypothetical protein YC2023_053282 [Brassica napus]
MNHRLKIRSTRESRSGLKENAANWFHTKRVNVLGDLPFTSLVTYTASELVLFKEIHYLLKECATQTPVWRPGDHSLHLIQIGEFIPCTRPYWIKEILSHQDLPYLDQICNQIQRLDFYILGCDLVIYFITRRLLGYSQIFESCVNFVIQSCVESLGSLIGELACLWNQASYFVVDCGINQQTVLSHIIINSSIKPVLKSIRSIVQTTPLVGSSIIFDPRIL